MGLKIGSTSIGTLYLGATRIHEAYLGNVKLFESDWIDPNPLNLPAYTMRFQFGDSSYDPTQWTWKSGATWTQVSSSPNVWDYTRQNNSRSGEFESKFTNANNDVNVLGANFTDITSMAAMFKGCSSLKSLAYFDTSNVTNASSAFYGTKLTSAPTLRLRSCTNTEYMFAYCNQLTSVGMIYAPAATSAQDMFVGCSSLTTMSPIDLSSAQTIKWIFQGCSSLIAAPVMTTSTALQDISYAFDGCSSLTTVPTFNTRGVTTAYFLFNDATSLVTAPYLDFYSLQSNGAMFKGCTSLTTVPDSLDFSNVRGGYQMFKGCSSLTTLPSNWDVGNLTNTESMFEDCSSLVAFPQTWDFSSVTVATAMCKNCTSLTNLPTVSSTAVSSCTVMFANTPQVTSGALALYTQLSTQSTPPTNYANCFSMCGSQTQTGAAELAQIPTDWGGTYAPTSYNIEILYNLTEYGGAPSYTSITSSVITQSNSMWYRNASGNWVILTSAQKSSLINGFLYDVDIRGLRIQNVSPWGAFSCEIGDELESTEYSGSVTVTDSNGTQIVSSSSATFGTNLICQISNQFAVSWSGGEPYGMGAEIEELG